MERKVLKMIWIIWKLHDNEEIFFSLIIFVYYLQSKWFLTKALGHVLALIKIDNKYNSMLILLTKNTNLKWKSARHFVHKKLFVFHFSQHIAKGGNQYKKESNLKPIQWKKNELLCSEIRMDGNRNIYFTLVR